MQQLSDLLPRTENLKSSIQLHIVLGVIIRLRRAIGSYGRFENFRIGPSLSNRIGTTDSNSNQISNLRRSLSLSIYRLANSKGNNQPTCYGACTYSA